MSKWIFQGNPNRYDVEEKLEEGKEETWLASRFRDEMKDGDVVYFWRGGEQQKSGIYGWGVIESSPEHHKGWGWGVPVKYIKKFPTPVTAEELESDPVWGQHLLFRMPVGTNHKVSEEEDKELQKLIRQKLGEDYTPEEERA